MLYNVSFVEKSIHVCIEKNKNINSGHCELSLLGIIFGK